MAAARSSWKRLHTELDDGDGDECLPISKRICSLHIESQTQELSSENIHGAHTNPYDGFSDAIDGLSSPVVAGSGLHPYSTASQAMTSSRLDFNSQLLSSAQNQQENCEQRQIDQRHNSPGTDLNFNDPMSNLHSSCLDYQQKHAPSSSQLHLRNLMFSPTCSYDQQNSAQLNQQVSQLSSIHNGQLGIPSGFHASYHAISSVNSYHENMPEYSHLFHTQQLPSGIYDPELGMEENPYYYSANQMLYEAHLYRIRRGNNFPNSL